MYYITWAFRAVGLLNNAHTRTLYFISLSSTLKLEGYRTLQQYIDYNIIGLILIISINNNKY